MFFLCVIFLCVIIVQTGSISRIIARYRNSENRVIGEEECFGAVSRLVVQQSL